MRKTLPGRALAAVTAAAALLLLASTTPAQAIVGGRTVQSAGEYPAVGRLQVPHAGGKELCTAILVRADVALTAKHCFTEHGYDGKDGSIKLRFGSHLARRGGQVRAADQVLLSGNFDLAVIHFPPVIGIRPLPLVAKGQEKRFQNGTVGLAVGWGETADGKAATQLQEGAFKISDQAYPTAQKLTGYNYLMKASPARGKVTAGDSGGPLIAKYAENGKVMQSVVGVLSRPSNSDAAYTKIASTRPWITDYLNRTPATAPKR